MKNEAADASITFEETVMVMINKEIGSPRVAIYIRCGWTGQFSALRYASQHCQRDAKCVTNEEINEFKSYILFLLGLSMTAHNLGENRFL